MFTLRLMRNVGYASTTSSQVIMVTDIIVMVTKMILNTYVDRKQVGKCAALIGLMTYLENQ